MKINVLMSILFFSLLSCDNEDVKSTENLSDDNSQFQQISKLKSACSFDKKLNDNLENNPNYLAAFNANEKVISDYVKKVEAASKLGRRRLETLTVRVVVNNIYRDSPLSMDLIEGQIEQLNEAFAGTLSGPSGLPTNAERFNAGDTKIKFVLDDVKFRRNQRIFENNSDLYRRRTGGLDPTLGGSRINIYVADLVVASNFENFIVGDAGFPNEGDDVFDHVFIDQIAFGVRPGSGQLNEGKLLAHEMGHYFGLFHLPGRTTESCRFDDAVGDTPNTSTMYFGDVDTGASTTSCGSQDMYWNFMNNTDDSEIFMFTNGQRNRMRATLLNNNRRSRFVR